ncbi:MAG: hypothetical protein DLM64_11665 [Solirubrobacterales bacterium]|nr:MAG: hypothetical protein DLM64_11665 [Solirubrobacterales bacterium]
MLTALARRSGAVLSAVTRPPDDRSRTRSELSAALERADLVIVSDGISIGPHDHVKQAAAGLSVAEVFWGVALQPGWPTWLGERSGKLVLAVPGNPVSAVVAFTLFAGPALAALQCRAPERAHDSEAVLGLAVRRHASREQALRVRLERRHARTVAHLNGPQGSHLLSSLPGADALALIPPGEGELEAGAPVALEPLAR